MTAPIGEDDWTPSPAPPEPQQPKGPACRCCGGQRSVDVGGLLLCPACDRTAAMPHRR